jgi:type IV secretory pathway VirB10-like protein
MKSILFVSIIPSVFVLLLATSLLILTVNTSQAFTPQPPPSTAGQPQQQQQPQQAPQANQSVSTQQNTTQSNQSAPPPPPPPPPAPQQQPQQKIPLDQLVGSEDFSAGGAIDSTIYTTNGNWDATGLWTLTVSEGQLTSFDTDMAWNNGTAAHTHEFQNFVMDDGSDSISIDSDGSVTIEGVMDVATNGVVSWPSVPAEIIIEQGKIITVSLDHEDTDNHFGGQAVHGTVTLLKPCSGTPGANMQIPTGAC